MKKDRLDAILSILEEEEISTQEELIAGLRQRGFSVTQATVSRDIKALRLMKATGRGGKSIYVPRTGTGSAPHTRPFFNIFREAVLQVRAAGSVVVIKCHTGMGNAACEALDGMGFPEIVGTIAGDNTIFAAVEDNAAAKILIDKIHDLLQ